MPPHPPAVPPRASRGALALDERELTAWGERFGRAAHAPLVVTLSGELGAGKTTLVRAICRGYGVTNDVTSPTFSISHRYEGTRSPVLHLDLYRIEREDELYEMGFDEMMAAPALVLVEWPERAGTHIPRDHVPISLQHDPADPSRRLLFAGGHVADFQREGPR